MVSRPDEVPVQPRGVQSAGRGGGKASGGEKRNIQREVRGKERKQERETGNKRIIIIIIIYEERKNSTVGGERAVLICFCRGRFWAAQQGQGAILQAAGRERRFGTSMREKSVKSEQWKRTRGPLGWNM